MGIMKKCLRSNCRQLIPRNSNSAYCEKHFKETRKSYNKYHRSEEVQAFYNSRQWRRFSRTVLKEHHFLCKYKDCNNTADTVHHIIEVTEDWSKRFERSNCMPICRSCHNKVHKEGVFP